MLHERWSTEAWPQVKAEFKKTATTDNVRTGITTAEFRKVYEAWSDYRAGRFGRSARR